MVLAPSDGVPQPGETGRSPCLSCRSLRPGKGHDAEFIRFALDAREAFAIFPYAGTSGLAVLARPGPARNSLPTTSPPPAFRHRFTKPFSTFQRLDAYSGYVGAERQDIVPAGMMESVEMLSSA